MEPPKPINFKQRSPSSSSSPVTNNSDVQINMIHPPPMENQENNRHSNIVDRITSTDVRRINRYLGIANIIGGGIFALVGFVGIFFIGNYSDLIIALDIVILGLVLVGFEFREKFPSLCQKVQRNFGFLFTAPGRAFYITFIGLLSFTQGWFGIIVGILFLLLAGFNFFLIHKHPGYQQTTMQGDNLHASNPQNVQVDSIENEEI